MTRYFISGHIDVSESDFQKHYKSKLDKAIHEPNSSFVIGDAGGIDTMAQEYLFNKVESHRVTVYCSRDAPRNNPRKFNLVSGYSNYTAKDAAMTADSDVDILWIRPDDETRALYGSKYRPGRISGTEKNLMRRLNPESEVANSHAGSGKKKSGMIKLPI